jgi:hypothetical protein
MRGFPTKEKMTAEERLLKMLPREIRKEVSERKYINMTRR